MRVVGIACSAGDDTAHPLAATEIYRESFQGVRRWGPCQTTYRQISIHSSLAIFSILLGLFLGSSLSFDLVGDFLRSAAGAVQSVFYRTLWTAGDSAVLLIASSETGGLLDTLGYGSDNLRNFWAYFRSAISAVVFYRLLR